MQANLPSRLIAFAGGSGSGKTTLATAVARELGAPLLSLDRYYWDLGRFPPCRRAMRNFDHPEALEWPLLRRQISSLKRGQAVEAPRYDFARHTRVAGVDRIEPQRLVIVEGIHALCDRELRALYDLRVFVETSREERFRRRLARDVEERGRTAEFSAAQFLRTVEPMHREFVAPSARYADLILSGQAPLEWNVKEILERLTGRGAGGAPSAEAQAETWDF